MAPKRNKQEKMSLGTFLQDEKLGSWADEMEDMPVSDSRTSGYGAKTGYTSTTSGFGTGDGRGYSIREELPLPDKPPFTVHLGNLSFDATQGDVQEFFVDCECSSIRIIEDKMDMKPKGFGYATFDSRDGLIKALALSGSQFQGRNIRISVADPPKEGSRPDVREFGDWSRKGPLPDLPGRSGGDRRVSDRGFGSDASSERRERYPVDESKSRDFGNWERKGPLSPLPPQERQDSRPRTNDGPRAEILRDRKTSPAAWGEGRPQESEDGSRPPRREFQERPIVERAPTAAEQDSQWRSKMRPAAPPAKSPVPSRDGSEAPSSPAVAAAPVGSRPKLNLAKRTVSEAPSDLPSPSSVAGEAKASPFGAARPIDTATKEKEIEEKRLAVLREKKEADDKAKEDKRVAKEAADAEKATVEAAEGDDKKVEILQREEGDGTAASEAVEKEIQSGDVVADKALKPKETVRDSRPKPAEAGAWRRPSGGPKAPRGDETPRGGRGGRGGGPPRGPRGDHNSAPRANGGSAPPAQTSAPSTPVDSEAATVDADGWSTVSKPKKNSKVSRAIAS